MTELKETMKRSMVSKDSRGSRDEGQNTEDPRCSEATLCDAVVVGMCHYRQTYKMHN